MNDQLGEVRHHLDAALAYLDIDADLERLVNPRHTDHDRHRYLPTKPAAAVAKAREEIAAALTLLGEEPDSPYVGIQAGVDGLRHIEEMLEGMIEQPSSASPPARFPESGRQTLKDVRDAIEAVGRSRYGLGFGWPIDEQSI